MDSHLNGQWYGLMMFYLMTAKTKCCEQNFKWLVISAAITPMLRHCNVSRASRDALYFFLRTEASEARYRPGRQSGQQGRVSYIKTFFPCIINPIIIIRRCWYLIILIVCRPLKMELCIGKRKSNCGWGHVIVWNRIIMWLNGFDICIKRFQCCYW